MKEFLGKDFLLNNTVAERLYHEVAKDLPIIDYHNHLSPKDIAENRQFNNLWEIWLDGDHYKWRAMRANGVSENYISGNATPYEKFEKWAATVPYTLRNPLYHWTHMELQNPFGIKEQLNAASAQKIYEQANEKLQTEEFKVHGLFNNWKVESLCTTDDPLDDLAYHQQIAANDSYVAKVLPTFRADNFLRISDKEFFLTYLERLSEKTGVNIGSFDDLLEAIQKRYDYFHEQGCRLFDISMPYAHAQNYTESEVARIFKKGLEGKILTPDEEEQYKSAIIFNLGCFNHQRNWTQQFHIGPIRNNNSLLMRQVGADAGCDSMDDLPQARQLSAFFNRLRAADKLAQTVLYNLNPKDNAVFMTMIGNFNDNSGPGKLQYGAGWWFLDQKEGIIQNLNTISNFGLLRRFIGMLTDSRSFLSYSRHEYFRRILCNLIGQDVQQGELPNDFALLSAMVEEICYTNAKRMLNF